MSAASLAISHFRWRTDSGLINGTPTFGASTDVNWSIATSTAFMIVFCVQNSGSSSSSSTTVKLQVSKNGGAFTDVTAVSADVIAADASSSPDGTSVSVSEVTGSGSFVAGLYSEGGATGSGITVSGNNYTNFVFGVAFNSLRMFNHDTFQFKIITVSGTSITATTIPTVTYSGGFISVGSGDSPNPAHRLVEGAHAAIQAEPGVEQVSIALYNAPIDSIVIRTPVILNRIEPAFSTVLRTWTQVIPLPLLGKDKFYGLGGTINFNWPNPPLGAPFPVALRGFVQGQNEALSTNVVTYTFRPPVYGLTWIPARPLHQPPNLLTSTLFGPPLPPPRPIDWPNPVIRYEVQAQSSRTVYDSQDTFFGLAGNPNFDWPNPPRGAPYPVQLRTWTHGKTEITVTPVTKQTDWPNPPLGAPYPVALRTLTNLPRLYLLPVPVGRQLDWPNPRGYVPSISLRTWADPLKLTLKGKDQFFGLAGHPNFNWPNPVLAAGPPNKGNAYSNVLAQNTPPAPPVSSVVHSIPFLATMGSLTSR